MKTNLRFLLAMLLLATASFAAHTAKAQSTVVSGKGCGGIKLGDSYSNVVALLGEPDTDKQPFSELGYSYSAPDLIFFYLGIDHYIEYNNSETVKRDYPVFRLYFNKAGKLVYFTLTSFGYSSKVYNKVSFSEGLQYFDTPSDMKKTIGKDYFIDYTDETYERYYFLRKGYELVFEEGELRAMHIFAPMSDGDSYDFLREYVTLLYENR